MFLPQRHGPILDDWTKSSWFLDAEHAERLWSLRYEQAELTHLHSALSSVYPGPWCRDYLTAAFRAQRPDDKRDGAIRRFRLQMGLAEDLQALHAPPPPFALVLPTFARGVDLAEVLRAKPQRKWLDRLRTPTGVNGTDFEAQVWANGLRGSMDIRRVPEKTGRRVGVKTPDFVCAWNAWKIGVEAKGLDTGEHDMIRFDHFLLIHPHAPDDRAYDIEVAPEIQALAGGPAGRESYRQVFDNVREALARKVWELEQAGSPLGEYVVSGAGTVTITPRDPDFPGRSASFSFTTEADQIAKAIRTLTPLRDAAAKFHVWPDRRGHLTVAILDVPGDYNADAMRQVINREVSQNLATYRDTDAIVWRRTAWHIDSEGDHSRTYQHFGVFVMRLPWCAAPDRHLVEFSRLLLASPHRLQSVPRRRDVPDPVPAAGDSMLIYCTPVGTREGSNGPRIA